MWGEPGADGAGERVEHLERRGVRPWELRLAGEGAPVTGTSPGIRDGVVVTSIRDRRVRAFDLDTGRGRLTYHVGDHDRIMTPAIAEDLVLVGAGGCLHETCRYPPRSSAVAPSNPGR